MSVIIQKPKYTLIPAGQEHIIHSVYDVNVIGHVPPVHKIKYVARVYIAKKSAGILASTNLVAVLKVTPNDVGHGIFDIAPIVSNYVSPEYEGGNVYSSGVGLVTFSEYKTIPFSEKAPHSIHLIDKFSANRNSVIYCKIKFSVEYSVTTTSDVVELAQNVPSDDLIIFNGVLYDTDIYQANTSTGSWGYDLSQENLFPTGVGGSTSNNSFLTNAPTTQYIRENDFATIAFFTELNASEISNFSTADTVAGWGVQKAVRAVKISYYDADGTPSSSTITIDLDTSVGGHYGYIEDAFVKIQYFGVGTQNQRNSGAPPPAGWAYYEVYLIDDNANRITEVYTFHKQTDSCKGYETVRLTWLNKWGTWDYYNFTQKNIRNLRTTRKAYKQLSGTWNKSYFQLSGHVGGMKNYNSTIKESITLNTDYITEEEASWLEQLFISNDVYMLTDSPLSEATTGTIRRYVQPVRITSEEMTRKTKANDKLIQYTFELETNRTKKSHKI